MCASTSMLLGRFGLHCFIRVCACAPPVGLLRLRRSSRNNRAGAPCTDHVTSQDRGAAPSPLSAPNRTAGLHFVLSTGERTTPCPVFRCGSVDDETKPELLLGEAPSSLSIGLSLAHGPLELLSSIQSHATSLPALNTSLIINCVSGDRTAQALFSAAQ